MSLEEKSIAQEKFNRGSTSRNKIRDVRNNSQECTYCRDKETVKKGIWEGKLVMQRVVEVKLACNV